MSIQNGNDRRVQRTCTHLKETMLVMMAEKPLHKITVMELCRACGLNRATFYAHFQDIFQLAETMEDEILSELDALMVRFSDQPFSSEQVSQGFFDFLQAHKTELQIFLFCENGARFTQKITNKIMPYFEEKVRQKYVVPPELSSRAMPLLLRFIASGYYSFFSQALQTEEIGMTQLAQFASRLGDACLAEFLQVIEE